MAVNNGASLRLLMFDTKSGTLTTSVHSSRLHPTIGVTHNTYKRTIDDADKTGIAPCSITFQSISPFSYSGRDAPIKTAGPWSTCGSTGCRDPRNVSLQRS